MSEDKVAYETTFILEVVETVTDSIDSAGESVAIIEAGSTEIISIVEQGPPGPSGLPSEDEMVYAKRTDIVSDALIYKGEATPGTAENVGLWRVRRLVIGIDGDVTEQWAGANANFDKVWADRLTLLYV